MQELDRDICERVFGPRVEPVDRGAVYEPRVHAAPHAQVVAHGRHAENNVQVRAHPIDEELIIDDKDWYGEWV